MKLPYGQRPAGEASDKEVVDVLSATGSYVRRVQLVVHLRKCREALPRRTSGGSIHGLTQWARDCTCEDT